MASEIAAFRLRNLDAKMLKGGPFARALHTICLKFVIMGF
jgi:hypothetical protein